MTISLKKNQIASPL